MSAPWWLPPAEIGPAAQWRAWWEGRWEELDGNAATRLARRHGFVLTVDQLKRTGWSDNDVRREVRRGEWARVSRGVVSPVVVGTTDDLFLADRRRHALAAGGAALLHPDQVVGARSGAILHGLPTFAVPDLAQLTERTAQTLGRRAGGHVFGAAVRDEDVTTWFGVPVLRVARTVVDLARHDRFDGIMAADAALREELVSRDELQRALAQASGWPGVRRARPLVDLANPKSESPAESITRLRLHDDGFPEAEPQVVIRDPERGKSYRVDLLLEGTNLILEVDGLGKYRAGLTAGEKVRETRLRALGYRVERVLWDDVVRYWPQTSRRLRALL